MKNARRRGLGGRKVFQHLLEQAQLGRIGGMMERKIREGADQKQTLSLIEHHGKRSHRNLQSANHQRKNE